MVKVDEIGTFLLITIPENPEALPPVAAIDGTYPEPPASTVYPVIIRSSP